MTTDAKTQTRSAAAHPGRLRMRLAAGVVAGALMLAAPAATAAAVTTPGTANVVAAVSSQTSNLPQTITLTTRRTGSVIL